MFGNKHLDSKHGDSKLASKVIVKLGKTIGVRTSMSAAWNQNLKWRTLNKERMTSKSEKQKPKTYLALEHEN